MVIAKRQTRRGLFLVVATALGAVAATWVFLLQSPEWRLRRVVTRLSSRPIEGRLTSLPYAPYRPTKRSSHASRSQTGAAQRVAATRGASLQDRLIAHVLLGNHESALQLLQSAPEDSERSVRSADLAALLHARAVDNDDVVMLTSALAQADAAVSQHDAARPAALFNRALVLEALGLMGEAAETYRESAAIDSDAAWRAESVERARGLARQTRVAEWEALRKRVESGVPGSAHEAVEKFPQQARAWAETEYLGRWGDCVSQGESCGSHWLAIARGIGGVLAAQRGECLLMDAVAAIDNNRGQATILAKAHRDYRDARKLNSDRRIGASLALYAEAEELFRAGASPMALMAAYLRATAQTDKGDLPTALVSIDRIDCGTRYIALRAQLDWERGRILARMGRLHEALEATQNAATLFTLLGESDNAIRMRASVASGLTLLGRSANAWRVRRELFRTASESGDNSVLELAFNSSGRAAIREGRWAVALSFFRLQLALPKMTPRYRFDALLWSSFCEARISREERTDLSALYAAAHTLPDEALRRQALADARLAEATLIRDSDPAKSLSLLDDVIASRTLGRQELRMPEVLAERARVALRLGRRDAAMADFERAVAMLEKQRKSVGSDDLRDAFFGTASDIFADYAYALIETGAVGEAFEVTDRANARILLDRIPNTDPLPATEIAARIRSNVALVQYACGTRGTAITATAAGRVAGFAIPYTGAQIAALAKEHASAIAADDGRRIAEVGQRLYSLLLEPVFREFPGTQTLVAITDNATAALAIPGLINPRQKRFVVEETAILIAPSATTYVRFPTVETRMAEARVVAVADPAFDSRLFPDLPRLKHARDEATGVRHLYRDGGLLIGADATRAAFAAEAASADVIHIAAHAVVDENEHARSVLPLTATAEDRGIMYSSSITKLTLRRSPVVVLAACHSATPTADPGTIRSLALSFIAAGSRNVIGTRWAIDDADTREFALAFHRHLTAYTAAEATRRAQLDLLYSGNTALSAPRRWAAFQSVGY